MEKQTFLFGKCRQCLEAKVVHRDNGDEREGKIAIGTCSECEKEAAEMQAGNAVAQADGASA